MVLQRDSKVALWGWADPGERVTIEIRGHRTTTQTNSQGQWLTSLGPLSAGGPYTITLQGNNRIHLRNILVGDVWLASGQSNMEFPVKGGEEWRSGINNADIEVDRAHYSQMRLIVIKRDASPKPLADVKSGGWRAVTPETVADFSAVAYLFGRELHERYHIPIGLIQSTWGGTVAEAWMSQAALRAFPEFHTAIDSVANIDESTQNSYTRYQQQREMWHVEHGKEDRGRANGHAVWATPKLDVSGWPTITMPRPEAAWGKDFDEFDGVVWFRRTITLSQDQAGKVLLLHLGYGVQDDTTYFNGERVGETRGNKERNYVVPGKLVRTGENVVAVRLVGVHKPNAPNESGIGMFGPKMNVEVGAATVPLAGLWSYQPGPDLKDFPLPDPAMIAARPDPNMPTELFNGMINPLGQFRIKGVIWYQGESNATPNRSLQYRTLFPALINDWRQHWGSPMPFLFVQLAGFGPEQPESAECPWAELREAQALALSLPNTAMATAVDIGDADDIHPKNKQDVAHRLFLAAAKVAYSEDVTYAGPTYQTVLVEGSKVRVRFSNLGSGLDIKDRYGYARGFEVAGEDHKFTWARAIQDGDEIIVYSDKIKHPVAVRYDWSNTPDGNVFNREGLPATPFRSDADTALAKR